MREWTAVRLIGVVDGDTLDLEFDLGFYVFSRQRVRLLGVDTPERGRPGFAEAKAFAIEALKNPIERVVTFKAEKYGRFVADVFYRDGADVKNLGIELLHRQLAVPYKEKG